MQLVAPWPIAGAARTATTAIEYGPNCKTNLGA